VFGHKPEPRCTVGPDGKLYVGVTSAMRLEKEARGEDAAYYGEAYHGLEGTGAHMAALDYCAHVFGWVPEYTTPAWPTEHHDERQWQRVMQQARIGFSEWMGQVELEPLAIEQEAFNTQLRLCGHVDLYCTLIRKTRRVKAIVDLKFVAALQEEHRTQIRLYHQLHGFREAQIGVLFQMDRATGQWRTEEVNLMQGLDQVMKVAQAAQSYLSQQEVV